MLTVLSQFQVYLQFDKLQKLEHRSFFVTKQQKCFEGAFHSWVISFITQGDHTLWLHLMETDKLIYLLDVEKVMFCHVCAHTYPIMLQREF